MNWAVFFEFGRGRKMVEPILRSQLWRKMYWYLMGFGIAFWVVALWASFYFDRASTR